MRLETDYSRSQVPITPARSLETGTYRQLSARIGTKIKFPQFRHLPPRFLFERNHLCRSVIESGVNVEAFRAEARSTSKA